jgi:UDPglucose 6-dehydrogenase
MREAPSVVIADKLHRLGATIVGYDPVAAEVARGVIGAHLVIASSWQEAVADADAVLVVTEWPEIAAIEPAALRAATCAEVVLDGRNVWDPGAMAAAGFRYQGIGRGTPG